MQGPAYPPAHTVAKRVEAHFARHSAAAARDRRVAPLPDAATIEAVIDVAFWSSLRREEGYAPRISLAVLPPDHAQSPLLFERPLPLTAESLTRMAPAVERPGIHLGVWRNGGDALSVWGTTRGLPSMCFVLEVAAPGLLVIKHGRGDEAVKFVNVAVLEGDQVKVLDERAARLPECPTVLSSLLGFDPPSAHDGAPNVLVELAVSMRAHGRGGSLLVVPGGNQAWRESIVPPIHYSVSPPHRELADLLQNGPGAEPLRWREALERVVQAMAGLTAVDGATLITQQYELLAFGAKIARRRGAPPVEKVAVAEPVENGLRGVVDPGELGGTRHQSAAQFVQDQHDAVALVASQDGRFTVFVWSEQAAMVHAHRVEALLL